MGLIDLALRGKKNRDIRRFGRRQATLSQKSRQYFRRAIGLEEGLQGRLAKEWGKPLRSIKDQPIESGEMLEATGFQMACRLPIFSYGKASLRDGMPWSGISRRNGVPVETLPGRKAETGQ
jgi:hypothetical protein